MKPLKIKVEKVCHSMAIPKSINHIFDDEKIQKVYEKPKLPSKTNFLSDLVLKTSERLGFHDNIAIIQRKLQFPKKLDGVGPVDNRPSTDKLHHLSEKERKRKKKFDM